LIIIAQVRLSLSLLTGGGAPSSELFSDDCRIAYRDLTGHSQNDTQQHNVWR
jgi:hypothetical protein